MNPNWSGRSKNVTADGIILYIENPKEANRKLLELINKLVNWQDTKFIHRKLLQFCTLRYHKEKLGNDPIYDCIKKNKKPRNKPT